MKIAILGGGISGLSAAWALRSSGAEVSLFEKSGRVGGWIETRQEGPFAFEMGPRTFQASRCNELLELIESVGLKDEVIYSSPNAKARYLLDGGKLRSMGSFFPTILGAAIRDLMTKKGNGADETVYAFAERRFGKRAAEQFFDPMAKGVYAGDIRRLSVKSCFPFLIDWEGRYGSVVKGAFSQKKPKRRGLFSLRGGMERLLAAIVQQVPLTLHLESPVEAIRSDGVISKGIFYPADLIVSALPAHEVARLAGETCPVRYESLQVVNLGFLQENLLVKKGFGYLVPSKEQEPLLGMIWDTCIFPVAGQTKLTAMVRAEDPVAAALDALKRHLRIDKKPDAICLQRAEIPQFDVGHQERIEAFKNGLPNLVLLGNYLSEASVNGCIRNAIQNIPIN
jgi:oxygen-dependent protoporphyrinogen oxidase